MKLKNLKQKINFILSIIGIFVVLFNFVFALPSSEITYHGKLTDLSDVPVADGNYDFVFKIFDASSGGTCVWVSRGTCGSPTVKSIAVSKGIFYTILGESGDNALTLDFNSDYWFEIKVGTNSPMTPRRKITANNYSINSGKLNGQSSSYYLDTSATEQTKSGNLNLSSNLALTGAYKDKDGDAGTSGQILSSTGTATNWVNVSAGSSILDADSDTKVQTEESADEDKIRFDTAGSERMIIDSDGRLTIPNTTNTNKPAGVIYKGTETFIHDFNYGNNGVVTTDGNNTFTGVNTGNLTMGSTATSTFHSSNNTVFGASSFYSNTTGFNNSGVGFNFLRSNTSGYNNTGIGSSVLRSNTSGYNNMGMGYNSLYSNTTGYDNSGIGSNSLYSNTTGFNNSVVGSSALRENTTGDENVGIGFEAGRYTSGGVSSNSTSNSTSNQSVYIGAETKALANGDINEIVIGYNAIGKGSNTVNLGNSSITDTYLQGKVQGVISLVRATNLRVINNTTNPSYQMDIDADAIILEDTSNKSIKINSINLTLDVTTAGANGLDTGSEASDTWYYIWVIYNPTTSTTAGLFSTSYSSPTMPSGYTYKYMVGAVRNNASNNFLRFNQIDGSVVYNNFQNIATGITGDGTQDISAIFPTASGKIKDVLIGGNHASTNNSMMIRGTTDYYFSRFFTSNSTDYPFSVSYAAPFSVIPVGNNIYYSSGGTGNILVGISWNWNF